MQHKLEVVFVQGTSFISRLISKVSDKLYQGNQTSDFIPSHVLLMLDNTIIFESSTYKRAGNDDEKVVEMGTRLLVLDDIDDKNTKSIMKRTILSNDCDPYLALKYVAKASNYHYSYSSIFKFALLGHLRKDVKAKPKDEYICSGLVLDALREPIFDNNTPARYVTKKFKDINSNSVTPLDLFMAFSEAGFTFREQIGFI